MARTKTNDDVLLEKWLTKPTAKIKNRVMILMREEILRLRGMQEEFPLRESNELL